MTLRVSDHVMTALESDAARLGISINALSNSILMRWAKWDRHMQKLGMITVPKDVFAVLVSGGNEMWIHTLVNGVFPHFREAVILIKGKYDLKRCIETLEEYMQTTGIVSDHTVNGPVHSFIIRHAMGDIWSIFIKLMMERLFAEFVPNVKAEYDLDTDIISIRVSLGSEWDEHDYE